MLGSCCDQPIHTALLNASNLTWTATGTGKFDVYDEEGLTLLPGGKVLDVDAYVFHYVSNGMNYELYNPPLGLGRARATPRSSFGILTATYEEGPDVLMPNGTVYATGANSCGAGHTAVYTYSTQLLGRWSGFPRQPSISPMVLAPWKSTATYCMMASPGFSATRAPCSSSGMAAP